MGTRHQQAVIAKDGEIKVKQYGQWDGYPDGQGVDILSYLKNGDLETYQKNLSKIRMIKSDDIEIVNNTPDWKEKYYFLSRDCGSDIHQLIEDGKVPFVQFLDEDGERWCEGFYTIDFKSNTFTSEFGGITVTYNLGDLPSEEEYLNAFKTKDYD